MATIEDVIRMKKENEERKWKSKLKTWDKISSLATRNPDLHKDLTMAYKRPIRVRNKG